jgi:hypothetical protein
MVILLVDCFNLAVVLMKLEVTVINLKLLNFLICVCSSCDVKNSTYTFSQFGILMVK